MKLTITATVTSDDGRAEMSAVGSLALSTATTVRFEVGGSATPNSDYALYNANYRRALNGAFEGPMRFYAVSLEFPDLFSNKAFRFSL